MAWNFWAPLPFEDINRYTARRKRDRLDRALLAEYLDAMGIAVDDETSYTDATLVRRHANWITRKQSLAEAKASWMIDQ